MSFSSRTVLPNQTASAGAIGWPAARRAAAQYLRLNCFKALNIKTISAVRRPPPGPAGARRCHVASPLVKAGDTPNEIPDPARTAAPNVDGDNADVDRKQAAACVTVAVTRLHSWDVVHRRLSSAAVNWTDCLKTENVRGSWRWRIAFGFDRRFAAELRSIALTWTYVVVTSE
ncbi:hypothetical protein EVAR_66160_1 [Eumeta japonica]|uniref:Uncharacterized protein n=1 Tax=Eumeta variegata TaxID=151549 RepID=A0A4C1ZLM9_EUMVA|nr:hypothetical protein EVAR_66160_1 [Eumeta japonica]